MKRKTLVTLIVGIACLARADDVNIVPNSGFEEQDPQHLSQPAGWSSVAVDGGESGTEWIYRHEGGNPDSMIGISTANSQGGRKQWCSSALNILPSQSYQVDFDYKTNALNAYVRLDFWGDAAGTNWKGMAEIQDTLVYNLPSLNKAGDWVHKTQIITTPLDARYVTVSFIHMARYGMSYADNLTLTEKIN